VKKLITSGIHIGKTCGHRRESAFSRFSVGAPVPFPERQVMAHLQAML
jgi:hypothetical protein